MNHSTPPPSSAGLRRAFYGLSLLLLPTIACASGLNGHHRYGPPVAPTCLPEPSYLPLVGAPALRFQAEVIVATATLPPISKETLVVQTADIIPAKVQPEAGAVAVTNPTTGETAGTSNTTSLDGRGGKIRMPAPILPDDSRPAVRAEDFLPFFQFPSPTGTGEVRVIAPFTPAGAPTPGSLPTSSATYIQTQR